MKTSSAACVAMAPKARRNLNKLRHGMSRFCLFVLIFASALSPFSLVNPIVARAERKIASYICPMDTEVRAAKPGKCPKCGMALKRAAAEPSSAPEGESVKPDVARASTAASVNLAQLPDTNVYDQHGRKLSFYNDLVKKKPSRSISCLQLALRSVRRLPRRSAKCNRNSENALAATYL